MINQQGRLFGKINLIDLVVLLVVFLFMLGVGLARSGHAGIYKQIRGTGTADFDLLIRGPIEDPSIFKVGDKPFITIRNQPYAPVLIKAVKVTPMTVTEPFKDGVKAYPDPSDPLGKNVLITFEDHAQITDSAIVLGGNKIKIGLPIDIEGFKYRLRGTVVDIRLVKQTK